MLPAIVLPFHDPDGVMFSHLQKITPQLKNVFAQAFVSVSPETQQTQASNIDWLEPDQFFQVNFNQPKTLPGEHYLSGYSNGVATCSPTQILHLCDVDRVAFALQSKHKDQFIADIRATNEEQVPLLFQRSEIAWNTHPHNYREIEQIATKVGEILFNKSLDFAWCHLAIQVQQLKEILPYIRKRDFSILAEIVLLLKDQIKTKNVDWLSWEDPFIYARDPGQLKKEREDSHQESHKRLGYLMPVLQLFLESTKE